MLALIGNLGVGETIMIVIVAILVFGKRLPAVAAAAAVEFQKLRRGLIDLRRETGIDEELRAARRALEDAVPRDLANPYPTEPRRELRAGTDPAGMDAARAVEEAREVNVEEPSAPGDAAEAEEPEREEKPSDAPEERLER